MEWVDILILIVLLFLFLAGFSRGFIKQLFSLTALIAGITSGILFYEPAGRMLIENNLVENLSSALVVGFILVAIVTFIIVQLLGWLTTYFLIGKLKLGWLNKLAGGMVGILIGIIIMFSALSWLNIPVGSTPKESIFLPHIRKTYNTVMDLIPVSMKKGSEKKKKQLIEKGEEIITHIKEADKLKSDKEN